MQEVLIFQIGAVIFGIFSFIFLLLGKKKSLFGTEFFISFITATSYAIMSIAVATTESVDGQTIYWSRWLFYIVACPLLVYDIAKILSIIKEDYPKLAFLTGLTMFNGFLASFITTQSRWIFFILSSIAFICLLYLIIKGKNNSKFKFIKPFVLIGWSLFPLVFLLAPTGFGILQTFTSESIYLILDSDNKIEFQVVVKI
jgi:sensory rhodopsin